MFYCDGEFNEADSIDFEHVRDTREQCSQQHHIYIYIQQGYILYAAVCV